MHKQGKKLFAGQTIYVGIDVHKKSWTVTILGENQTHKTFSQNPDSQLLARYLKKHFPGAQYTAVYEAGFSGFWTCRQLRELGIECEVIHPVDVPTTRKERLQKSDKIDSRKLARTLRNKEFEFIHIPDEQLEADRSLVRQRAKVSKDLARIKNRVKSLLMQFGISIPDHISASQSRHWSKAYINWLEEVMIQEPSLRQTIDNYIRLGKLMRQELATVTRQVRNLTQEPRYEKNFLLLRGVPGVGLVVGITFLVELGDIRRFKSMDELCNFIGLVPSMHGSGETMKTGKMIKRGRKQLKILLVEAAWKAIGADPALMVKYNEFVSGLNGRKAMKGNKAIIRIARKLLARIRHILIHQQEYEIGVVQ